MNNFEIELRYEILEQSQLSQFLAPLKLLYRKQDIDIYLDTKLAVLYQKGIFIRIRNNKKLDIKFNRACLDNPELIIQDYCEEYSFALPLQDTNLIELNPLLLSLNLNSIANANLEQLKSANNLIQHYIIVKVRTSYAHKSFTIAVDEVADLGIFLEIELMAQTLDNLEIVKQEMKFLLEGLKLKQLKTGYGTLLLRKKDFAHYLQGRFILEEDKIYKN